MNIILGFGDTEKRFEENLEKLMLDHVAKEYSESDEDYFSDAFVKKISVWASNLAEESRKEADEYKTAATYPDRYTSFWVSTIADASHIIFVVSFHHINRRHAMSPDGWALMQTKPCFHIDTWDAGAEKHNRNKAA